jgi:hypothetical protein
MLHHAVNGDCMGGWFLTMSRVVRYKSHFIGAESALSTTIDEFSLLQILRQAVKIIRLLIGQSKINDCLLKPNIQTTNPSK